MVAAVRGYVGEPADQLTDKRILELIDRCGSVGLACDCLLMDPQPTWLERWHA